MKENIDQLIEKTSPKKETNKLTLSQLISQKYPQRNNSKSAKDIILNNYTNPLLQESKDLKETKKSYFEKNKTQTNELSLNKEKDDYAKQSQKRMDIMQAVLDDELKDSDIGGNIFRKKNKSKTCIDINSKNKLRTNVNDRNEFNIYNNDEANNKEENINMSKNEIIINENKENFENIENNVYKQNIENVENIENLKNIENIENNEKNEDNVNIENIENNENVENEENNEISENNAKIDNNKNYNVEINTNQLPNEDKEIIDEINIIDRIGKNNEKTRQKNFFNENNNKNKNNINYEFTNPAEYNKEYIDFNKIKKNSSRAKSTNTRNYSSDSQNKNEYKYKIIKGNSDNIFIDVYINSYNNKKIINNETPFNQKYSSFKSTNTKLLNSYNKYKSIYSLKFTNKFNYPPTSHEFLKFSDKYRKNCTFEIEKKLNEIIDSLRKIDDFGDRNLTTGSTTKKDFNYIGKLNCNNNNKKNYIKEKDIFGDILNKNRKKKKYRRDNYIYKSNSCNYKSGIKDCNVINPFGKKKYIFGNEIQAAFNNLEKKRKNNSLIHKYNSMRNLNYPKYQSLITNNRKEKRMFNLISIGKKYKDSNIYSLRKRNIFNRATNAIGHGIYFKERKKTAVYPVNPFEYDKNSLYL